jgi:lipopolysaccharide transport system ATP-binding protein
MFAGEQRDFLMSDTVIQIEHLSKRYRLGIINNGMLFRDIQTWIALKRGKEDPHSKIGENKYAETEDYFWALKDINLEIKQGDRVGIIGKNGAGKSTLLKILSRITTPTEGVIKIKGRIASLLEVGTGFHVELTGRENIYLNGAILGMKKRRISEKLDEIVAFSGIEHHIDTPVKRYSSGMYVRLAFAVAAHLDSDILIADEVLAVGDAEFQKKALGKMRDLSTGQGRTVLFVSHNMGAVKGLCNRGILLKEGIIINNDTIHTVINEYDDSLSTGLSANNQEHFDIRNRRGAGAIHFISAAFSKTKYYTTDTIYLTFTVETSAPLYKIYFQMLIRHENMDPLTAISYVLADIEVPEGYRKSFQLEIPKQTFRPGRYPIYLWLGDEHAIAQGNPINYDVLDDYLQPIIIEMTDVERENVLSHTLAVGQITIKTILTPILQD